MKSYVACAVFFLLVLPVSAQRLSIPEVPHFCFEDPIPGWRPVGCEVIDCCPGCPGLPELVFTFEGDPRDVLTIDLGTAAGIKTSGNARVVGTQLLVRPGTSTVSGFTPAGLAKTFGVARYSGGSVLNGTIDYRQGGKTISSSNLRYRFVNCPRPPFGEPDLGPIPEVPTGTPPLTCPSTCAKVIQFMTDQEVPANMGISLGAYREVTGYEHLNVFVRFDQASASEPPVDLGVIFAFDAAGRMGSRRYVNLESNVASPQATNFISVSGANAWHGSQWGISSYNARLPVMGPFVQVFVYNTAPTPRRVSVWGYASD